VSSKAIYAAADQFMNICEQQVNNSTSRRIIDRRLMPAMKEESVEQTSDAALAAMVWHPTTHVVHSMTNKGPVVKLLDQCSELQAVIRGSMHILITDMVFADAYPPYDSRVAFARTALLAAARLEGEPALGIKARLKAVDDGRFAADLADLVSVVLCQTMSRCRSNSVYQASCSYQSAPESH
jgi:hypothetical protein